MWWMIAANAAKTLLSTNSEIKVAKSQNKAAMSQLGKQINQINLQRAQNLEQTSAALFNIDIARDQATSQVQLQSAASGTLGASVKDAVSTVNTTADRQEASAYSQLNAQMTAYQLATSTAVDNTHNQMDWESGSDKLWNNVIGSFGSMIGSAAASKLDSIGSSDSAAPVSAVEGTYDTQGTPTSTFDELDKKDYGYDLWGRRNSGVDSAQSWKSYLNN